MPVQIIKTYENTLGTDQVTLTEITVNETCRNVIETMKNGLPKEAHSIEAFEYILSKTKEKIRTTPVKL